MTILVDGGYTHLIDLGDCRDIYLGWGDEDSFDRVDYYTVSGQGHIYKHDPSDDLFYRVYENTQ